LRHYYAVDQGLVPRTCRSRGIRACGAGDVRADAEQLARSRRHHPPPDFVDAAVAGRTSGVY